MKKHGQQIMPEVQVSYTLSAETFKNYFSGVHPVMLLQSQIMIKLPSTQQYRSK
jgi:hypothetical protein